MAVGRLTGRPVLRLGLRQLVLGGLVIAVTYGADYLIGSHGADVPARHGGNPFAVRRRSLTVTRGHPAP